MIKESFGSMEVEYGKCILI